MNKIFRFLFASAAALMMLSGCAEEKVRVREDFNDGWRFHLGDVPEAYAVGYDDSGWRELELPHDWAVEGDFSIDNPSGTGGGALPGGIGWYRKTFVAPENETDRVWRLEFDGVYMNSEVFVNGESLGVRPYGYISFGYDISPYLRWGEENVIAVRVDNAEQPNSRWYSGCGIYRNVWMLKTSELCIPSDGLFCYVASMDMNRIDRTPLARLNLDVKVKNCSDEQKWYRYGLAIKDAEGRTVCSSHYTLTQPVSVNPGEEREHNWSDLQVPDPVLWDVDNPYLYTVIYSVYEDDSLVDEYQQKIGIRTFEFDAEKGFILNGRQVDINGVCLHHDFGCLGAAFNVNAARRQLEILKEMGCNGIRTAHNPPAPELLDLCDEMGFIVQDEAFDMWRKKKTAHDYSRYFNEWHERDLRDFILRDRNHPSVFMWSIGNEVLEQWSHADADTLSLAQANLILNFGHSADMLSEEGERMSVNSLLTKKLADMVRELDPTRPVTAGCNEPAPGNHLFRSGALDIIGYNYHNQNVADVPKNFPGKPFIITESNSALMTRGYYRMPSDQMFIWPERWDIPFYDESFACSSYENCHVPWGNTHEETLKLVRDNEFICGQYIWTGFDYIGEPTPYGWPARSSFFGIVDLAGFPKDVYYLYQSEWTDKDVLHLFPHWNWEDGQEIDMWCYYNDADEVELFVNGVSQGIRSKTEDCLHTVWRVVYQPGTVEVVARKDGQEVRRKTVHTAGEPAAIRLTKAQYGDKAEDDALCYVTVEIVDAEGNLCPDADNLVTFDVEGPAFIAGVDNGNPVSMERFKDNKRKAFYGKCLAVLQADESGKTVLTARSEGLASDSVTFTVR